MDLINRYIYAVTRNLPSTIQEEVSLELRAHIGDMLADNPTESEIKDVLKNLGNPRDLAEEYQPKKRYLIGPKFYGQYIFVLKLVTGIVATVLLVLNAVTWGVTYSEETTMIQLIVNLINTPIQALIQSALWVTFVFYILERKDIRLSEGKEWSIEDLTEVMETPTKKISRGESLFSLIFSIFGLTIFYFTPQLIVVHTVEGVAVPIFNLEALEAFKFLILIYGLSQIGFQIWQWIYPYWTKKMAIINGLLHLAGCFLFIGLVSHQLVFNPQIIKMSSDLNINIFFIERITLIILVIISLVDVFEGFRKSKLKTEG